MANCNCGNVYNIGMGCCEPVLGPIENYYTKYQVDKLIEGAVISGCCITPEEVDEKIEEAISGITVSGVTEEEMNEAISAATDGLASEEYVNNQISSQTADFVDGEELSSYTYDKATIDSKIASGGTFDPTQYYNKTATDELLAEKLDASAYTPTDLSNYYNKQEVDAEITEAASGKAETTAVTAINSSLTAHTANTNIHVTTFEKNTWNNKQNQLSAGRGIAIVNNEISLGLPIWKGAEEDWKTSIKMVDETNVVSGNNSVAIGKSLSAVNINDVEIAFGKNNISLSDDSMPSGRTIFTVGNGLGFGTEPNRNAFDIRANGDIYIKKGNNPYDTGERIKLQDALSQGGGSTYTAGRAIDINSNNEISLDLPIASGTGVNSLILNYVSGTQNIASGNSSVAIGESCEANGNASIAGGWQCEANTNCSIALGTVATTNNDREIAVGFNNKSISASTNFGDSGNTLFSVGNGSDFLDDKHNAFEVRQDGSIYVPDLNGGSSYSDRPMIKLQDYLVKVWIGTKAQFDAITVKDNDTIYLVTN